MPTRRIRVKPIPEGAETEKVRCLRCGAMFEVERHRQFALCPRCGEIMAREAAGAERSDREPRAA